MLSRSRSIILVLALLAGLLAVAGPAGADGHEPDEQFRRVSSFAVYHNGRDIEEETVAEIVDATADGMTLVYTDSPREVIGFVDITDPSHPAPGGVVSVGGEPTAVSVAGSYALAGVNTSDSFVNPSGYLAVIDIAARSVVAELPLGGQPDSVKVSPDGRYAAVVIENERNEDGCADGLTPILDDDGELDGCLAPDGTVTDPGELPQAPPGLLQIVDLVGHPGAWTVRNVDLTGLAGYAPEDPEPEFVDVNDRNFAVVTLQENNHLVLVDLVSGRVRGDFAAGAVTLVGVDAQEDGRISLTDTLYDVPREPDAVTWLPGNRIGTANEGDLFGGSRGFSIFERNGAVVYDSGTSYEELAVRYGHYPEDRSENKGSEPESIEFGRYGGDPLIFVGSERGSFVAVYRDRGRAAPEFLQLLPTGLAPEGLLAIPGRDLLVVSSEADDPPYGVRATISVYERSTAPAGYPDIEAADDAAGTPIGWGALSGLAADPHDPSMLYAVWDSYYSESQIFTVDVSGTPAVVAAVTKVTDGGDPVGYDLEGIAVAPEGGFWLVSEGAVSSSFATTPNLLIRTDGSGVVLEEIGLPEEVEACRAATIADESLSAGFRRELRFGFEGVTVGGNGSIFVAQQKTWTYADVVVPTVHGRVDCGALGDAPGFTRIWEYDPVQDRWRSYAYELADVPPGAAWVGLSEIVWLGDTFGVIERDNATGDFSEVKTLVEIDLRRDADKVITSADKLAVYDLLPDLRATNGWITDKPEGFAVAADGSAYVVTDNDGVEDWSGENWFLRLGDVSDVFGG